MAKRTDPERPEAEQRVTSLKNRGGRPRNPLKAAFNGAREEFDKAVLECAPAALEKLKAAVLAGDMGAVKMVIDRLSPNRRGYPMRFDLPSTQGALEAAAALDAIMRQVADGVLTMPEDECMVGMLTARIKIAEGAELAADVAELRRLVEERAAEERAAKMERRSQPELAGTKERQRGYIVKAARADTLA